MISSLAFAQHYSADSLNNNLKQSRIQGDKFNKTRQLRNTNLDLAHVLDRVSGVKVREDGGLGSGTSINLNGFTGKHVKLFIDGVPMEGAASSFGINNIPASFANSIEVYKGVVPVGNIHDYIIRTIGQKGVAVSTNHGKILGLGVDLGAHYYYKDVASFGGSYSIQNTRNKERLNSIGAESVTYNDRVPNLPYAFGGADASYTFKHRQRRRHLPHRHGAVRLPPDGNGRRLQHRRGEVSRQLLGGKDGPRPQCAQGVPRRPHQLRRRTVPLAGAA